eukprot:166611-Rhodomonas_salina.3
MHSARGVLIQDTRGELEKEKSLKQDARGELKPRYMYTCGLTSPRLLRSLPRLSIVPPLWPGTLPTSVPDIA